MATKLSKISVPDVQNWKDLRGVALDKAGIKDMALPMIIYDRAKGMQHVTAKTSLYTSLSADKKGAHPSKLAGTLIKYSKRILTSEIISKMLEEARSNSENAFLEIGFSYFIDKQSPVSKIIAPLDYKCKFIAELSDRPDLILEVQVPVTTLCPDSKELSKYGAHNQRSVVTIQARGNVWFEDLIKFAETSASSEIFQVLEKMDDRFVTEKAYENPKFAEDLVRDIAVKIKADKRISWFKITTEDYESNHNYNIFASVEWKG